MERDFEGLGVSKALIHGLASQAIKVPTEIQSITFTPFLENKDFIAQAETGAGKTLAYLIPLFMKLDLSMRSAQAIVLTPTHELAAQVAKQAEYLALESGLPIRSALIIGSAGMTRQIERLKEKPHLIVGSSGRILDLIQRKKINAQTVKTIVIDEADRMLDTLNIEAVKAVIKTTQKDRHLTAFSASIDTSTLEKAKALMKEAQFLKPISKNEMPESIKHYYITCEWRDKINMVRKIVHGENANKVIVFLNNPENIEVTVDKLNYHFLKAAGIYGGIYKTERKQALDDFREGRIRVLVASDIGARGLDIPGVSHVINLDIPEDTIFYLHRAGRTGRQGNMGTVISVVTEFELKWIRKYERTFHIHVGEKEMSFGKLADKKQEKSGKPRNQNYFIAKNKSDKNQKSFSEKRKNFSMHIEKENVGFKMKKK